MAVQEYEPGFDTAVPEEEISPLDYFKAGLHGMVMEVESGGVSSLGHLLMVRAELKQKRVELMRESTAAEQLLRSDYSNNEVMSRLTDLQEELILVYHELVWTEGYIHDRQPK